MNTFKVLFKNEIYNYHTGFNGSYEVAVKYFLNEYFNFGIEGDNMQKCIKVEVV